VGLFVNEGRGVLGRRGGCWYSRGCFEEDGLGALSGSPVGGFQGGGWVGFVYVR
jgi:hypothetical protein